MTQQQNELHRALLDFDIDRGPVDLTFPQRLARENGWTLPYATRVVDEYKKFVLLAMTSEGGASPSHQVDQAWHLHMTYTDSYWNQMCGGILRKPLHHNPTKGGKVEDAKYEDMYRRTLKAYEQVFGEPPPADIWPAPELRFGRDLRHQMVNTDLNLVISKVRVKRAAQVLTSSLVALFLVGCAVRDDRQGLFIALMIVVGVLFVIGLIYFAYKQGWLQGGGSGGCGGGCSTGSSGCSTSSGCSSSGCGGGGCGGGCGGGGD